MQIVHRLAGDPDLATGDVFETSDRSQGSIVGDDGIAIMLPRRISSSVLSEVVR